MLSASCILALVILTFIARNQLTGFLFNTSTPEYFNVFYQITGILLPFLIWCIANWCITTLVDGEGFFTDIFIASAYALVPLIIINIPMIILSRVMIQPEATFYTLLDTISVIWTVFLIISGLMTVHQFTMSKTIFTILITILGMFIIIFIFLLFFTLIQDMVNFCKLLFYEMQMRINY